jgi:hypothetical protein
LRIDPLQNKKLREEQGELSVAFASGILTEEIYMPMGVDALWLLVGVQASLEMPFNFEIRIFDERIRTDSNGFLGGFSQGKFCLFDTRGDYWELYTKSKPLIVGTRKVVVEDWSYQMEYWIPEGAFMSFEDMVEVGNDLLFKTCKAVRTPALKFDRNWEGDIYRTTPDDPVVRLRER